MWLDLQEINLLTKPSIIAHDYTRASLKSDDVQSRDRLAKSDHFDAMRIEGNHEIVTRLRGQFRIGGPTQWTKSL
jgi:hypothetical protein